MQSSNLTRTPESLQRFQKCLQDIKLPPTNHEVSKIQSHLKKIENYLDKLPEVDDFPQDHDWLNVPEGLKLSFKDQLKNKIVVIDFWSACCINCIHVMAEMEYLEQKFKDFPEVVFIGCHSAKFENEKDLFMLRQNVIRYNLHHAIFNDCKFKYWESQGINCWPSIVIIGPHKKAILGVSGESNQNSLEACIFSALQHYGPDLLDDKQIPMELEIDKVLKNKDSGAILEEQIRALKQNLNNPGKVIVMADLQGLPYPGVTDLMAIADTTNNRFIIVNMVTLECLDVIGTGKSGFVDGIFAEAQFHHTQGMCHFINQNQQHCLMVCDTKNHLIRELNLHTKTVRRIVGIPGLRGSDRNGGKMAASLQEIASPWDLIKIGEDEYIIAMAGTHQIWVLNVAKDICYRYSGSGAEGNLNSRRDDSQWAQPSGISLGLWNDQPFYFIADAESSCVRGIDVKTQKAYPIVGGDHNYRNLFAFGDVDGSGFTARLQHPIGLHYTSFNRKLYVADSYNHKIKIMDFAEKKDQVPVTSWLGNSKDKNPRVVDGKDPRFFEPNAVFAYEKQGELFGIVIADTGNNCIRMAKPDGDVVTFEIKGIPDVRETSKECKEGICEVKL